MGAGTEKQGWRSQHYNHPNNAIIDRILAYAKKKNDIKADQLGVFEQFIGPFYANLSTEDLERRPVVDLYGIALSHYRLISQYQPSSLDLKVYNPTYELDSWHSPNTVIQLVMDDMPFLVDSIKMLLDKLGISIYCLIHTGGISMQVSDGLVSYLSYSNALSNDTYVCAPIYVEITRLADEKACLDLRQALLDVLHDVHAAVSDWEGMQTRMQNCVDAWEVMKNQSVPNDQIDEVQAFIRWIMKNRFTFLGARDYVVKGKGKRKALEMVSGSGLGVLRDESQSTVIRHYTDMPQQARAMAMSRQQWVVVFKTNTVSTVHRAVYTDCIDIKIANDKGEIERVTRVVGLFTSVVYNNIDLHEIPLFRHKVDAIFKRYWFPRNSHSGKELMHVLGTLQRDDWFHASVDDLSQLTLGVMQLQNRKHIRLFVLRDAYQRYVSCYVYLPRDTFTTEVINKIQSILLREMGGVHARFSILFEGEVLARVHYLVRVDAKNPIPFDVQAIENMLSEVGRSWYDEMHQALAEYFGDSRALNLIKKYPAFPAGYREKVSSRSAIVDIENMDKLQEPQDLGMGFSRSGDSKDAIRIKLYRLYETVPLFEALPRLENMGLSVIEESAYPIEQMGGKTVWINEFKVKHAMGASLDRLVVKHPFREAFIRVWHGDTENDMFNSLILLASLDWRDVTVLRAYAAYMKQIGFGMSQSYVAKTLVAHHAISSQLIQLFKLRFDPKVEEGRQALLNTIKERILVMLDEVTVLDEDRILRTYMKVIEATLRTNFYQADHEGVHKSRFVFKFDPGLVPALPLPLPQYEIFVYSPECEGLHLRYGVGDIKGDHLFSCIARGGIRRSDRKEDYRKEVNDLAKTQRVKNAGAGIVPGGAKGAFVIKHMPKDASREEGRRIAEACYRSFIGGLLDVVDNLRSGRVYKPHQTVCYDTNDAYLVVAADKGTATYSDVANSIAEKRQFWLGDAFASGGSTGYDHKKMGITARGAWVAAEHHFKSIGVDINKENISVVGIGDMSGDVFGNGMLLSRHIKLLAAFNHMHIFIDIDPDPEVAFEERKRLFELPRSAWSDYNPKLISKGGGVFSRQAKALRLSDEIQAWLGIEKDLILPSELIRALLRSKVDLLWNGGIGTYVKAVQQTDAMVGDHANDSLRINATELRARVVAEGGNLGLTQLSRIQYAVERDGMINTDFIDNAGGVDCSDHEVNLKILLNALIEKKDLTYKQRNLLLTRMQDAVAQMVIENNYAQNEALAFVRDLAKSNVQLFMRHIEHYDNAGLLDVELNALPTRKEMNARIAQGKAFTRPEIAVLMSYAKMHLDQQIKQSGIPDNPDYEAYLFKAFPALIHDQYAKPIRQHRLRREIISTQLSNQLVSDMGPQFIYQLHDETGSDATAIVRAFVISRDLFGLDGKLLAIANLNFKVNLQTQLHLRKLAINLVRRSTRWFLSNVPAELSLAEITSAFREDVKALYGRMSKLLLGDDAAHLNERLQSLVDLGVPADEAAIFASCPTLYHTLNIIAAAKTNKEPLFRVAKIYFMLVDRLALFWFRDYINSFPSDSNWAILARASFNAELDAIQQALISAVLRHPTSSRSIPGRLGSWMRKFKETVARWNAMIEAIKSQESKDHAVLPVAMRQLKELVDLSMQYNREHASGKSK